jgi:hypothetical protein
VIHTTHCGGATLGDRCRTAQNRRRGTVRRAEEERSGHEGRTRGRAEQQRLTSELGWARAEGLELVGPGGLPTGLTRTVLETAREGGISHRRGYDQHDPAGRDGGPS